MSPRRKSGLSPEDLQALKHLPAVLTALEHLQEQHAKARALMGSNPPPAASWLPPEVREQVEQQATKMFWEWRDAQGRAHSAPVDGRPIPDPGAAMTPRNPTLDTPERREYDEAKRAGRKVPEADPFANASPAQRERMAEQRAVIDAERAARGLPPRGMTARLRTGDEEVAVRTETLDTVSDGTTPLAGDADDGASRG